MELNVSENLPAFKTTHSSSIPSVKRCHGHAAMATELEKKPKGMFQFIETGNIVKSETDMIAKQADAEYKIMNLQLFLRK